MDEFTEQRRNCRRRGHRRGWKNPCSSTDTGDNEVGVEQRRSERRRYDDVGQSDGFKRLERQDEYAKANRSLKGGRSNKHGKLRPRLLQFVQPFKRQRQRAYRR